MFKCNDKTLHSVLDVVTKNTGMSKEELLHDSKTYTVCGFVPSNPPQYVEDGIMAAAKAIAEAVKAKKKIYICGDYDVDGITASSILYLALHARGVSSTVRLPRRMSEGYGLSVKAVNECDNGQFLITVDNGISSLEAIKRAKEKKMTVVVTDHHLPYVNPETQKIEYPCADLIVDPNATDFPCDFRGYCGAGLAFKIACVLLGKNPEIYKLWTIAAIGTLADSVPLIAENRRIVRNGLQLMQKHGTMTEGLKALLQAYQDGGIVDEEMINYNIAPALNAPGRLNDFGAMDSFHCLTCEVVSASYLADKLVRANNTRKNLTNTWTRKTIESVQQEYKTTPNAVVAYMEDIPEGLCGIIAGRVAEKMHVPCFLFANTEDPKVIKASGRTYGDVNLKELLDQNAKLTVKYGGHAEAAGVSILKSKFEEFKNAVLNSLSDSAGKQNGSVCYDLKIPSYQVREVVEELKKYGPYGVGNPKPIILMEGVTLVPKGSNYYYPIGTGGVKLMGPGFNAISFDGMSHYAELGHPRSVDLVGELSENVFNGNRTDRLMYTAICPHVKDTEKSPLKLMLDRRAKSRNT